MLSKKEAGLLRPSEGAKCRIVADGCEKTGCPLPTREVVWAPEFFFYFRSEHGEFWCIQAEASILREPVKLTTDPV